MSTSPYNPSLHRILPLLSTAMGTLALGGGIYGVTNPQSFSDALGIPVTAPTSSAIPFVSFVGARNLGTGVTVLALLYTGQKKAVGTLFMCGVITALADAWICSEHNATDGKAVGHTIMGILSGLLGAGMYWG